MGIELIFNGARCHLVQFPVRRIAVPQGAVPHILHREQAGGHVGIHGHVPLLRDKGHPLGSRAVGKRPLRLNNRIRRRLNIRGPRSSRTAGAGYQHTSGEYTAGNCKQFSFHGFSLLPPVCDFHINGFKERVNLLEQGHNQDHHKENNRYTHNREQNDQNRLTR